MEVRGRAFEIVFLGMLSWALQYKNVVHGESVETASMQ